MDGSSRREELTARSRRTRLDNVVGSVDDMTSSVALKQAPADRPPIRIVIADDSYLARLALKHLLEGVPAMVVVGECEDPEGVAAMIDEQRADLLITDIRMPPSYQDEGIRLAARLRESHPALAAIVLSTYAGDLPAIAVPDGDLLGT